MKKLLLATLTAFALMTAVCGASPATPASVAPEAGSIAGIVDSQINGHAVIENGSILGIQDDDIEFTRGCCSHHRGVSYCDSSVGRLVCNDGTYSPSCGC